MPQPGDTYIGNTPLTVGQTIVIEEVREDENRLVIRRSNGARQLVPFDMLDYWLKA